VFTLWSDIEGESRVIKEALMCGLPVLVKAHLRGGGLDFLNADNSRQFSSTADGAERMLEMLEHPERFHVDAASVADQIGETANIPRFVAAVRALFDAAGVPFDGELDTEDLSRKLPSHAEQLPRDMCYPGTDDLRSAEAVLRFVRGVCAGVPFASVRIGPREQLLLRAFDRVTTGRSFVDRARKRLQLP
jgi:hypothetical protein